MRKVKAWFWVMVVCLSVGCQRVTAKGDEQNQITLEDEWVLKPPAGLEFEVAAIPPKVEITLFKDLPQGGRGTLWSSWGDGLLASNGRYYTAIGDHRGVGATSRVYEYDPGTKSLRPIVDVAQAVGQRAGEYGHGKIHAGIHEAKDGWFYFATFWGKPREVKFDETYRGSILLRWHPKTESLENLGAIAPERGLPASHFDSERELIYFLGLTPNEETTELIVFDMQKRGVRFRGGADIMEGKRAFMHDLKGRVYVSAKARGFARYDPETNKIEPLKSKMPESTGGLRGNQLRAAARPTKEGIIYAMTGAGRLFAFDPEKDELKELGPNFADGDYTAVMVLSADERFLYFPPGAHGSSVRTGTPIVRYEVATGKRTALCFLNPVLREKLKYNIGGSYNLQIDRSGERLFMTFNGAPYDPGARKSKAFGLPSVGVIHIPASAQDRK
jgi:hypothetical protein